MTAPVDLMAAFYAAVSAVEERRCAEVEVEYQTEDMGRETRLTITVRREIRHLYSGPLPPIDSDPGTGP